MLLSMLRNTPWLHTSLRINCIFQVQDINPYLSCPSSSSYSHLPSPFYSLDSRHSGLLESFAMLTSFDLSLKVHPSCFSVFFCALVGRVKDSINRCLSPQVPARITAKRSEEDRTEFLYPLVFSRRFSFLLKGVQSYKKQPSLHIPPLSGDSCHQSSTPSLQA